MELAKALEVADYHFRDGLLYENGTQRLVTPQTLQDTVVKLDSQLHDYYISPGSTSMMNDAIRYREALRTIQQFQGLIPLLNHLGVKYAI